MKSRELAAGVVLGAILLILLFAAPAFFAPDNLRDLLLNSAGVMLVALGMTLVIVAGHIDISVGSQFAAASIAAGLLAKAGLPMPLVGLLVLALGAMLGAANGLLITRLKIPSIVVTLATMIILRDLLRWTTEGAWVQNLPVGFQWAGLGQTAGSVLILVKTLVAILLVAWCLRNLSAGRQLFATGSNPDAAVLAGIRTDAVVTGVFVIMGILSAAAAMLNAIRFSEVPGNPGAGLELKAIAAVVVGGASITGGRGTVGGTVLGVLLLSVIGSALTYLGINPYWEKAVQGVILLAAAASEAVRQSRGLKGAYASR